MAKTYFIADPHYGDDRIRRYENRPFRDTKEMDLQLIDNWNGVVEAPDFVYILGDFGTDGYEAELLSKLNGRKYLIKGNHDDKNNDYYRNAGFEEVYDHPIIIDGLVQRSIFKETQ